MQLGAKHVESPFIEFGQISTLLYFLYFIFVIYGATFFENTSVEIRRNSPKAQASIPIQGLLLQSSMVLQLLYVLDTLSTNMPYGEAIYEKAKNLVTEPYEVPSKILEVVDQQKYKLNEAYKAVRDGVTTAENPEAVSGSAEV